MKVEMPSTATTTTALDDDGGDGDAGNDYTRIDVDDYCDPLKKEPDLKLDYGDDDGADYSPPDVDDYHGYGSPQEDLVSKVIDIYHHPVKEEPDEEPGGGDGDVVDINCYYECDPLKEEPELVLKEEPELVAAGDDTDDDGGSDVGYDCSHCGISLCTGKFRVKHGLRCKVLVKQKELESEITKLYHCGYCSCPFLSKDYKEQHQRKCRRKRQVEKRKDSKATCLECDKCEFVTKYKESLKRHLLMHNKNNAEWFACTQCSYKTVRKGSMTSHMKTHSNSFSCCCPICGKSFRRKQRLDEHLLKLHSDESDEVSKLISSKTYTCNICDQYSTTRKPDFNEHLTVIHNKVVECQKYQCPRCPYSTFYKYHLKTHLKTHAEQKDYQCIVCKKQFTRKIHLDSHILCFHADNVDLVKTITSKIHRCQSCSFKTVETTRLKNHVRSKHI